MLIKFAFRKYSSKIYGEIICLVPKSGSEKISVVNSKNQSQSRNSTNSTTGDFSFFNKHFICLFEAA